MVSKKVDKYLNKYQEKNYASKERKIEKSNLGKHTHRGPFWKAPEASGGDCLIECEKTNEEKEINVTISEGTDRAQQGKRKFKKVKKDTKFQNESNYSTKKQGEENGESKTGIGITIQGDREESSGERCEQSGSSSSSGGNQKVRRKKDVKNGPNRKKEA